MVADISLPTSILHLAAGEVLLVVAALLAAFIPLGEHLRNPPPAHSSKWEVPIVFVTYGPQAGSLVALGAIFLCFIYAWVHKLGILQASLALLFVGVVIFIGVVLVSLLTAFIAPPKNKTEYERVSDEDKNALLGQPPSTRTD
jgi:hypothetical protein